MHIPPADNYQGFVFDLDGTIYLGDSALPGAVQAVASLRQGGKRVVFITNKPLSTRQDYARKLTRLGIPTNQDEIITSAFVLGSHLARELPELNYYLVGEENLAMELRGYGLNILPEFSDQDPKHVLEVKEVGAVIVAFDRTLDYRKLNTAYQALVRGARFFATNADKTCPMPGGSIPDAGATIAALEHLTGRQVEILGGKPSPLMMQVAAETLQLSPDRCLAGGRPSGDRHAHGSERRFCYRVGAYRSDTQG